MKKFAIILLLSMLGSLAHAQELVTVLKHTGSSAIIADGSGCAQDNGATAAATATCSLTSVTAGDAIVCNVAADDGSGNAIVTISDISNGIYTMLFGNDGVNNGWQAMAYALNSSSGTISPIVTANASLHGLGISCQAYKNVRTTQAADGGALNLVNAASSTNPNAGTSQSPTGNGELILGLLQTSTKTPTAGSGYTLLPTLATTLYFPEYAVQTTGTSTNCPYVMTTDTWSENCAALLPSSAGAGVTPLNGVLLDFHGNTNGSTVTTTNLTSGTENGLPTTGGFTTFWNYGFSGATGSSLTSMVYTNSPTINRHTPVFVNGISYPGNTSLMIDRNVLNADKFTMTMNGQNSSASLGFFFETTQSTLASGELCDLAEIAGSGDSVAIGVHGTSSQPYLALERVPSTLFSTPNIPINFSTLYWITYQANSGGTHQLAVYETSTWTQIGTATVAGLTAGNFVNISFGNEGSCTSKAGHNYYGNITVDETGLTYPILP